MTTQERTFFGDSGNFMTVRHLTLRGTNLAIGRALGKIAIERYGHTPATHTANPLFARARREYLQTQYPIHCERMQGVAAAFGVESGDDRYDFSGLAYLTDLPLPAFGCSAVYYPPSTTESGHGCLSRNYDFSIGTMAEVMRVPVPPDLVPRGKPVMSQPYVMEWYPEDGGYASLAIHAFDVLGGTLDGINSEGLVVSILADHDAINELGPKLEAHPGPMQIVGLHELMLMRYLLDTCANAAEAKLALLTVKQHYRFVPLHYLIADRRRNSFIYENSTGRNMQYVIGGDGQPQFLTNFQLYKHATPETMPGRDLTLEHEAYWRYHRLAERLADHSGPYDADEMKAMLRCVSAREVIDTTPPDHPLRHVPSRTIWQSFYEQDSRTAEYDFYLGEEARPDNSVHERRSGFLSFTLETE